MVSTQPHSQPNPPDANQSGERPNSAKRSWERPVEIVKVVIYDREYVFKSNRPELVREIAELINRLHRQVKESLPGLPHQTDYPAHVSFSLARDLIKSRREVENLKSVLAECEERLGGLAALMDLSLKA